MLQRLDVCTYSWANVQLLRSPDCAMHNYAWHRFLMERKAVQPLQLMVLSQLAHRLDMVYQLTKRSLTFPDLQH